MAHYKQDSVIAERYEVKQIRRGGMGIVYLCYDRDTQRPIALKSFQDQFLDTWQVRDRFNQEILTWIQLGKHPHIVQAHRAEIVDGKPFAIVELVSGPPGIQPDLRSWLVHRRVDTKRALEIAIQICRGMQYAAQQVPGIVHRDLKPENVLLTAEGTAKITDFGLAKVAQASQHELAMLSGEEASLALEHAGFTKMKGIVGTPQYMAPEQWRREELDVRTDIYALGCILFEMMAGQMVFQATTLQELESLHTNNAPPRLMTIDGQVSSELDELVSQILHKDRDQRPSDFGMVQEQLETIYNMMFKAPYPNIEISNAQTAEEILEVARTLIDLEQRDAAKSLVNNVLEQDPNNWRAWSQKGLLFLLEGKLGAAEECIDRSLEIKPASEHEHLVNKGSVYIQRNELPRALEIFDEVLQHFPHSIPAMINKAIVHFRQNNSAEAKELFEAVLQLDPLNWTALYNKLVMFRKDLSKSEYATTWVMALRASVTSRQRLLVLGSINYSAVSYLMLPSIIGLFEQILDQLATDISDESWKQIAEEIMNSISLKVSQGGHNLEYLTSLLTLIGIEFDDLVSQLEQNAILCAAASKLYHLGNILRIAEKIGMHDIVQGSISKLEVELDALSKTHTEQKFYISKFRSMFYFFISISTPNMDRQAELRSKIDNLFWAHPIVEYLTDILFATAQPEFARLLELLETPPPNLPHPRDMETIMQHLFEETGVAYETIMQHLFEETGVADLETMFALLKVLAIFETKHYTDELVKYIDSLSPEIQQTGNLIHLKAETLYHLNRVDEAIPILQEALSKKPENSADLQKTLLLCEARKCQMENNPKE